jgi:uncharacterized OsmC-like protein
VLAILAMLALKGRAARGSGRLRSSLPLRYAPWHRMLQAGTGKQALQPNQKAGLKWLIPAARGTFLSWRTRGHFYFALTGQDHSATPVEIVLAGLASCLTAGVAAVAQARKVQLRSVSATLEAGMDVRGILGMDEDVRNGFDGIKVTYKIDADASPDDIKAIVAQSQKRSAVYDIITNPTNVTVEVA